MLRVAMRYDNANGTVYIISTVILSLLDYRKDQSSFLKSDCGRFFLTG